MVFNGISTLATMALMVTSLRLLPKRATKLIVVLICIVDIAWSTIFLAQSLYQIRFFTFLQEKLARAEMFFNPLFKNSDIFYLGYTLHRFAIIMDESTIFTVFKESRGILLFVLAGTLIAYLMNSGEILDSFFVMENVQNRLRLWIGPLIVKSIVVLIASSLHLFAVKSMSHKLDETAVFVKSLPNFENCQARLISIARIKKFNMALLVIQLLMPVLYVTRLIVTVNILAFCEQCDFFLMIQIEGIMESSFACILKSICAIAFAAIHFLYVKNFGFCNN